MKQSLFLLMFALCLIGCDNAANNEPDMFLTGAPVDVYYVKYVATVSAIATETQMTIRTPNGDEKYEMVSNPSEYICGPVYKGFEARGFLSMYTEASTKAKAAEVSIYLSKNDGPFTLVSTNSKSLERSDKMKGMSVAAAYVIK